MSIGLQDVERRLNEKEQSVVKTLQKNGRVIDRVRVSEEKYDDVNYGFEAEYREDKGSGSRVEAFGRVTGTGKTVVEKELRYD